MIRGAHLLADSLSRSRLRILARCCLLAATALLGGATQVEAARCLQPELEPLRQLVQPVPPEQMVRTHLPGDPMTPPPDPDVGDSWLWYTWKLNGPPMAEQKMCTVRGEGENVYIVVEDSQWLTQVSQADVDRMVDLWDNASLGQFPNQGIYDLDTQNFGPAPDELDNDPKIYVLQYDFDVNADGFFWVFDEFPDGTQPYASNECEVVYLNSSDFEPGGDYLISVQAHEFQHMIHWLADEDEFTWVDEGCAELAMWIFGHPDDVVSFPSNPDNNLTSWNGGFADYIKTYLWTLYFYEHFGGQDTILNLVSQPANSNFGVQQTLIDQGYSETFAQVVRDWVTANFLDDLDLEGGRYGYAGEDLPTFASITKSTYPVMPTNASVNHYAADYVKFINGQPQRLFFDGGDTSDWTPRVIKYLGGSALSVEDIPLDAVDAGYFDLPQFGSAYDQVVLVVGNVSTGGLTSYSYSTAAEPASVGESVPFAGRVLLLPAGPNPFSSHTEVRLLLEHPARIEAQVMDVQGRLLVTLASGDVSPGEQLLRWDGRDAHGSQMGAGKYFLRVKAEAGGGASHPLTLVR